MSRRAADAAPALLPPPFAAEPVRYPAIAISPAIASAPAGTKSPRYTRRRMLIHGLDDDQCTEVLRRTTFGRLACSRHDQPYLVSIHLAFDQALRERRVPHPDRPDDGRRARRQRL